MHRAFLPVSVLVKSLFIVISTQCAQPQKPLRDLLSPTMSHNELCALLGRRSTRDDSEAGLRMLLHFAHMGKNGNYGPAVIGNYAQKMCREDLACPALKSKALETLKRFDSTKGSLEIINLTLILTIIDSPEKIDVCTQHARSQYRALHK